MIRQARPFSSLLPLFSLFQTSLALLARSSLSSELLLLLCLRSSVSVCLSLSSISRSIIFLFPVPTHGGGGESEKDAKLAQKLAQLQPFIALLPHECMGQLASFRPI
jgi:hypothetical protein